MESQIAIIVVSFVAMLGLNVPVAIAIGLSTLIGLLALPEVPAPYVMAQRMSNGIASFPLLAIPFFVMAGILMGEGGMARRLIDFASILVGGYRGGLAYVSTLTCMLFGAISGSATAAVSSIGGTLIPEMQRKGYNREYSVAVTSVAATSGLLIPPSNVMIVYAVVAGNVSVAAMFVAGILPGVLVGLITMVVCWMTAHRALTSNSKTMTDSVANATTTDRTQDLDDVQAGRNLTVPPSRWRVVWGALPSLLLVLVVMVGILGGVFSATEAAAVSVLYAFIMAVCVYREVPLRKLPDICLRTGVMTSVVFFLISTSQAMSWSLAYQGIPQAVAQSIIGLSDSPWVILLLINVVLLVVGTFMDMTPAVLIFTPIFLPVAEKLGIHPVHFGIIMIANLCIGLCTPPVGTCLFVGCSVGKTSILAASRAMIPFIVGMIVALLLTTYWPAVSMWLPRLLELAGSPGD